MVAGPASAVLGHRYLHSPVGQVLVDEVFNTSGHSTDSLWLLGDHQGTSRDIVDDNGVLRKHTDFDSFGKITNEQFYAKNGSSISSSHAEAVDQAFAFTGEQRDTDTGLQLHGERWYDPRSGRWLSEDSLGFDAGDANLYRYVGNSPLNYTDPTGTTQAGNPLTNLNIFAGGYSGGTVAANKFVNPYIDSTSIFAQPTFNPYAVALPTTPSSLLTKSGPHPATHRGVLETARNTNFFQGVSDTISSYLPWNTLPPTSALVSIGLNANAKTADTLVHGAAATGLHASNVYQSVAAGNYQGAITQHVAFSLGNASGSLVSALPASQLLAAAKPITFYLNPNSAQLGQESAPFTDFVATTALGGISARVSVSRTAVVAEPNGSFYSAAFETRLNPSSYPGVSRAGHFQEANGALLGLMEADSGFAQSMRELGVTLERTPTGLAPRQSPAGWSWHHASEPGVMQLVPRAQHAPGSIFQDVLHPNGRGGYSIWGQ